jgi:hypothetical protein
VRDAAIHRVSRDAFRGCGSLAGSQWIATGYALAMTTQYFAYMRKYYGTPRQCHCEEQRDAAIHHVLGFAFRLFSSDLNLENGFLDLILRKAQQIEFTLNPVDKNKQNL